MKNDSTLILNSDCLKTFESKILKILGPKYIEET
jgi:hypothetical protein